LSHAGKVNINMGYGYWYEDQSCYVA